MASTYEGRRGPLYDLWAKTPIRFMEQKFEAHTIYEPKIFDPYDL